MLSALLHSLGTLRFPSGAPDLLTIIVDNDVAGSARDVVSAHSDLIPGAVAYVVEPEQNISLARNVAVRTAERWGADYIAFVDDDEVVQPNWLAEMLEVQRRYEADAVCGPVLPIFERQPPEWIEKGGFFLQHRLPTGSVLDFGLTNNALVSTRLFTKGVGYFDPEFGISGGGDAHFFMRAQSRGAKIVWADEALVEETIPSSRMRTGWILRRAFRIGHAYVRCRKSILPLSKWFVPTVGAALVRVGVGLATAVGGVLTARRWLAVKGARTAMHGIGTIASLLGFSYHEYTKVHGG